MLAVGRIEQFKVAEILQGIELKKETGLLTITQGEQHIKLYFQHGKIVCIGPCQRHTSLENGDRKSTRLNSSHRL